MNHVIKTGSPVHFSTFINYLLNITACSAKLILSNDENKDKDKDNFNENVLTAKKNCLRGLLKKRASSTTLPSKVLYKEKTASGFSHMNWYTKAGGGKDCLSLEIIGSVLRITPVFQYPGLRELLDLEHNIKADLIINITEKTIAFKKSFMIKYSDDDGLTHTVEVLPKKPQNFRNALNEMMQAY